MLKIKYVITTVLVCLNIIGLFTVLFPKCCTEKRYTNLLTECSPDNKYRLEVSIGEYQYGLLWGDDTVFVKCCLYDNSTDDCICEYSYLQQTDIMISDKKVVWNDEYVCYESPGEKFSIRMYYEDLE